MSCPRKPTPWPADASTDPTGLADELPSLDGLVAGTVALMTAHARPCPAAALPPAQMQQLLARKVVSHLFFLAQHPQASPALRQSLAQAHAVWQGMVQAASAADQAPMPLPAAPAAPHAAPTQAKGRLH